MTPVQVTVAVGRKTVPVEQVKDEKVARALRDAARDVGARLDQARCPTHNKGPTHVRLHFNAAGVGDLKYESCCEELGQAIAKLV